MANGGGAQVRNDAHEQLLTIRASIFPRVHDAPSPRSPMAQEKSLRLLSDTGSTIAKGTTISADTECQL
jgi:hypothetical protein